MIVGIGVDMVDVRRVERSLERFGQRFAGKVLSPEEQAEFRLRTAPASWLAKRFAVKEAVAKALGTGMRGGVHFGQITVTRGTHGAPGFTLAGAAAARAERLGAASHHVSVSDEGDCAVAFVILEG